MSSGLEFSRQSFGEKWNACPPSMIYLAIAVISLLISIFYGEMSALEFLCTIGSIVVVYLFLVFLCKEAPIVAWILIILQLLVIAVQLFSPSTMSSLRAPRSSY
jgi:hypothetical protein